MTPRQPIDDTIPLVICEDDRELRGILLAGLPHFGINPRGAANALELDDLLVSHRPTVVILDIGLPGEDGLSISRRLRAAGGPPLGVIMLTARGALEDRLEGLKDGADVYFVKPVDLRELAFAVRNLHRRVSRPAGEVDDEAYVLDPVHSTLTLPSGPQLLLTTTELRILRALALNPGGVVERITLLNYLNQPEDLHAMQRLETHISRLRHKVRQLPGAEPLPLHARHGVGYAFLAPLRIRA
jgi:DNA-binding response OmpR family regulator